MAKNLSITATNKADKYTELLPQIEALIAYETNPIANLANISSALKMAFGFFWVGFYLVEDEQLVLGPFQGDVACTRIPYGKGVCGTAWATAKTQLVEDVELFPGHIACSSQSRSEVVVPILHRGIVVAVLDIDSDRLADFDSTDVHYLERLAERIAQLF